VSPTHAAGRRRHACCAPPAAPILDPGRDGLRVGSGLAAQTRGLPGDRFVEFALGHGTGSVSAAKPLTCKQQYDAWKTGRRAQGKQLDADLSKVSAARSGEDIPAVTSGLKTAGADAVTLDQYPMLACANPGGY
jgi:hypothetical protein